MATNPRSYQRKWNAAKKASRTKYFKAYYLKHRAAKRAYSQAAYQKRKQTKAVARRSLAALQRALRVEPRPSRQRRPRNRAALTRKENAPALEHDPALPGVSPESPVLGPGDNAKDVRSETKDITDTPA